jgi:small nuclear ribonucleoprotein (snRNP)-like protein
MNRRLVLIAMAVVIGIQANAAIVINGNQRIQIQGNGVLLFNSPTVVNELPDVSLPSSVSSDSLQLSNGDFLYGKLVSIGQQHEIRWQHPDALQPIEFKTTNITQIDLANTRQVGDDTNNCKIDLINNDTLKGNLVSCDKDSVMLDTACAGKLRLSRAMLESLVLIPPAQPAAFSGPTGLEGWTQGKSVAQPLGETGQWTFRNDAFYAGKPASIARDVHLPDTAQIEFDLVWKGTLHMAIALYSDSLQPVSLASKENAPNFGGFYSFQVNSSYMDMMPIKQKDPLKSLGAIAVPALMQRNRAHFDLRCSKRDNKLALLINGVLVKEWIDADGFAGQGTMMRFVHQGQGVVKLSNIRIRPWDGQLEQPTPAQAHRVADSVRLSDGTTLKGNIENISNGKLAIATGSSTIHVDLSKLRQIDFASKDIAAAQTNSQPVRVVLTSGNVVSGQLQGWNSDAMTLNSPAFGTARFNPKSVSRLQFSHD